MLTCKEVTRICSDEFERPLTVSEQASLHLHLMVCTGCTNYRQQLQTLRLVMRAHAEGRALPGDARPDCDR